MKKLLFILLLIGCSSDDEVITHGGFIEYLITCHNCTGFYQDTNGNKIQFYIDGENTNSFFPGRFKSGQTAYLEVYSNFNDSPVVMKIILGDLILKEGGTNNWSDFHATNKIIISAVVP